MNPPATSLSPPRLETHKRHAREPVAAQPLAAAPIAPHLLIYPYTLGVEVSSCPGVKGQ